MIRLAAIAILVALAACTSSTTTTPVASKCGSALDATDSAACWIWADSLSRTSLPEQNTERQPLLRSADGQTIMSAQPRP